MDGIDDLAVSAPTTKATSLDYLGTVYIFFGSENGLSRIPDVTIRSEFPQKIPHIPGEKWDSQFNILGEKLEGFDIDGDGFKDLLIGSPHTTTSPSSYQRGKICAFYAASRHLGLISVDDADWFLEGSQNYELFGSAFQISGKMLYVGSPGYRVDLSQDMSQGRVYGFGLDGGVQPVLRFTITSNSSFSQFGQSIAIGYFNGAGEPILLISSSTEVIF